MKKPLEHSLKFIVYYLFITAVGFFLSSSLFMVYTLCKTLIAGEGIKVVDSFLFVHGMFYFMPLVLMMSALFSIFYFIRHPDFSIVSKIVFFVIYICVWIFLIPLSMDVDTKVLSHQESEKIETVSPGYFRKQNNQTVFYSRKYNDAEGNLVADGCVIRNNKMEYFKGHKIVPLSSGFADPIMKASIQMNPALSIVLKFYRHFLEVVNMARLSGITAWLCIASIALSLFGILFISRFSYWRLLSVIFSLILFFGVITLNAMCFFFAPFRAAAGFMSGVFFFINGNSFVLIMNIVLFILFSVIGLIVSRLRRESV